MTSVEQTLIWKISEKSHDLFNFVLFYHLTLFFILFVANNFALFIVDIIIIVDIHAKFSIVI